MGSFRKSNIGQKEILTQQQVIEFLKSQLGYDYLGDWNDRANIHTYKYNEAVKDGVVLDLRYEARDIDQYITSQRSIAEWFDVNTKGLSDIGKAQVKQRWGTLKKMLSAKDRLSKIVADIWLDMKKRDRLQSGHGNAMLVSDSIYSACRLFEMFQQTDLKGKFAIITSYKPTLADIKGELSLGCSLPAPDGRWSLAEITSPSLETDAEHDSPEAPDAAGAFPFRRAAGPQPT